MPTEPRSRPRFGDFTTGTHYHHDLRAEVVPERLRMVIEALGPPGRVLDVGCHTGFLGAELMRRGWDVEGVESNGEAAAVARSNDIVVTVGNIEDPAVWEGIGDDLDAILFLDVLEHTYDPWSVLAHARSHLRPGGRVLITLPNVASWKVLRPLVLQGQFVPPSTGLDDPTHIRFFTLEDAKDLLRDTGYGSLELLPAWTCVPGSHRFRRLPVLQQLWTRAWVRVAPSFAIAVPLLIARPVP